MEGGPFLPGIRETGGSAFNSGAVDEQVDGVVGHREIVGRFGDDQRADFTGLIIRLNEKSKGDNSEL